MKVFVTSVLTLVFGTIALAQTQGPVLGTILVCEQNGSNQRYAFLQGAAGVDFGKIDEDGWASGNLTGMHCAFSNSPSEVLKCDWEWAGSSETVVLQKGAAGYDLISYDKGQQTSTVNLTGLRNCQLPQ